LGSNSGGPIFFSRAEIELTNWVPVWDFDPGAPLNLGQPVVLLQVWLWCGSTSDNHSLPCRVSNSESGIAVITVATSWLNLGIETGLYMQPPSLLNSKHNKA